MGEIEEVHSIEHLNEWDKPTYVDVTFSHTKDSETFLHRTKCVVPAAVNTYDEVAEALLLILMQWVSGFETPEEVVL